MSEYIYSSGSDRSFKTLSAYKTFKLNMLADFLIIPTKEEREKFMAAETKNAVDVMYGRILNNHWDDVTRNQDTVKVKRVVEKKADEPERKSSFKSCDGCKYENQTFWKRPCDTCYCTKQKPKYVKKGDQ